MLAESRSCTERRANPSVHPRPAASTLFSNISDPQISSNERRYPFGSGGLTQMEGAVSTNIPYKDEHKSRDVSLKEDKEDRASDGVGSDPLGDKLYVDAASVTINSEYETDIDNPLGDDGLGQDKSDSSCWRPELPPTALLEYIKTMATQRFLIELKSPSGLSSVVGNMNDNLEKSQKEVKCLEHSFGSSALVAIGILIEELTRECIVSWSKRNYDAIKLMNKITKREQRKIPKNSNFDDSDNRLSVLENSAKVGGEKRKINDIIGTGPLGPVTSKSLRIEARLQLQGAKFKPDSLYSDDDDEEEEENEKEEETKENEIYSRVTSQNENINLIESEKQSAARIKSNEKVKKIKNIHDSNKSKYLTPALLQNRLEVRNTLHSIFLLF